MPSTTREVRLGDRNVVVPRFNGYKATVAGEIIATITKEAPGIADKAAEFRRNYEAQHVERVTRAEAKLPRNMKVIPLRDENGELRLTEDGAVAIDRVPIFRDEDFGESGVIEIPSSPTQQEQFGAVFPYVWELARNEIVKLIALVTAPNSELAEADENGTVDDFLTKTGKRILHEADIDQIVEALGVAAEVLREQFAGKPGIVGKIATFIDAALGTMDVQPEAPIQDETTPSESAPSSSTDSPEPTDGTVETRSTEPIGAS